ncbi:hypothetical protein [Massilia pseudoviolaceinigra]|uniref:hypothetical protein n=1 Tax=Massilia pseudoviolaceinigra TaxID=3057165 RepID=UPI00279697B0|nr:hypothetical protein [Massilia sp. CCM 9206]MDQ1919180.1 hypothetical protein [Massilia sp. CCM 9206]
MNPAYKRIVVVGGAAAGSMAATSPATAPQGSFDGKSPSGSCADIAYPFHFSPLIFGLS